MSETEKIIVSALLNNDPQVMESVTPYDFTKEDLQAIVKQIRGVVTPGILIEISAALGIEVKTLATLQMYSHGLDIDYYLEKLKSATLRRELQATLRDLTKDGFKESISVDNIINNIKGNSKLVFEY